MIDNFKGKYFFLSNSSPSEIKEEFKDGTLIIYPTVEHAFQATKTRDIILRKQIALCSTPRMAKRLAEHISLREDWDEIQLSVMFSCIRAKFSIPELQKKLLATKNEHLEEKNTRHDNFYGSCYCDNCKSITGKNWLGIILMQIREEARRGELSFPRNKFTFDCL